MGKNSRNGLCRCKSGKKYKHCCLGRDAAPAQYMLVNGVSIPAALQCAFEHHRGGCLPEAEAAYQDILKVEPNQADALHLLGCISLQRRELNAAVALISKAVNEKPTEAIYLNSLGNAFRAQGRADTAVASYRQALSIQPEFAQVHSNLGIALQELGRLAEAAASYRQALSIMPNCIEAYSNLGTVLQDLGQLGDAAACYRQALLIQPDFAQAHRNLGAVLHRQGFQDEAVACYRQALLICDDAETRSEFAQCINRVKFSRSDPHVRTLVTHALSEAWGRPSNLLVPAQSLVKLNPGVKECIDRAEKAWPFRLSKQELFGHNGLSVVAEDGLLQCLLENTAVSGLDFEHFLTMSRVVMLNAAMDEDDLGEVERDVSSMVTDKILTFYCALARQCFINEYVFTYSDDELIYVESLREKLAVRLASKSPIPDIWPVALAAYFPLTALPFAPSLLNRAWPEPVANLLVQQIREPEEERNNRSSIFRLTEIEDCVSRQVREQYEANPYPRWVKAPHDVKASLVDVFMHRQFPDSPFQPLGKVDAVDILIAGCGTGQQSIQASREFCSAKVLAVDLSLASLCYAKRKTDELGLKNIVYAQADIMALGLVEQTFDIVESVGVLHHLADPVAGWQVLLGLLRPGGLMRLGFYSELARRDVVAARDFIAQRGYSANSDDIRQCRQELMAPKNALHFKELLSWGDFYGMSECRDLLFHVQEHCYTLLLLKDIIAQLGLCFIGFLLDPLTIRRYVDRFPDDPEKTNLDNWHLFETENPGSFIGMYQFWVQKCR